MGKPRKWFFDEFYINRLPGITLYSRSTKHSAAAFKMLRFSIILLLLTKVLRSSCEGTISLTFVIDDTQSMWNDIEQVKTQVDQIMDVALEEKSSEIKEFVLVSFNDPGN